MQGKKYILAVMLIATAFFSQIYGQVCDCVTTGNCPVGIEDNGTFQGTLNVTVNGPNNLGLCPLTSLCFTIQHTWIGDLSATLTSPSGQNYLVMADVNNGPGGCGTNSDDLDICIVPGNGNPVTGNSEYICNGATPCLVGAWTMPCGGVSDPVSGAVQAPSCNLNDFNIPGSPANGTWTLTINDICGSDVGQLINFSLTFACGADCITCEANGGDLNDPDVVGCQGSSSLNINPTPVYSGGNSQPDPGLYGYSWVIAQNGVIQSVNSSPSVSTLPPGNYTMCGFSYINSAAGQLNSLVGQGLSAAQSLFNSSTAPFCGDFSDDCINITVGPPIPPTQLDTFVCTGQCVDIGFTTLCSSGTVTLESWLGCDSVINVTINFVQPAFATENVVVCPGGCVEFNNQLYCAPGPEFFVLPNWQGCDSTITIIFDEIETQAVISPDPPPILSCTEPSVQLDGLGSIPFGSSLSWQGPNGFTSNQGIITVDEPGTYTLTVTNNANNPPCISETSIFIDGDATGPSLQLNSPPPSLCIGESFELGDLSVFDANFTNPIITYHSGTPATVNNQLFFTNVSPLSTTTYYILATTGNCTDEIPVTLTVNQPPVATFTVISPICLSESTIVTFNGQASPTANFNWDFGGGSPSPGFGAGPHSVNWNSGGTYTISLDIEDQGCLSGNAVHDVEVGEILQTPIVNCTSTSNEITFSWDEVPGATGYNVTVLDGPSGIMVGTTGYYVNNLMPNQSVTISVEAISGNSCPNSVTEYTCFSQDCPPTDVSVSPVADICLTPSTSSIQLSASQTGGASGGTYTWSGPGVNATTGLFNPANANIGANTIIVSYLVGTCTYNGSIVIDVNPTPTSDFTVTSPICSQDAATVAYTGTASNAATFSWNFGGGTATPGTGVGPHTVSWPNGGAYTVTLTVTENSCPSTVSTQSIDVETPLAAPQINCNTTTNSIEFVWDNVPGAIGYDVNVIGGGGSGTAISDTSMLFSGLSPGDAITLQVVAIDPGPCDDVPSQVTCIAQDCPSVTIAITPVDDICLVSNTPTVILQASVNGGTGSGTLTWSGSGVSIDGVFDPSQANTGANLITALYQDGVCTYSQDITINVVAQPLASFTTPSPVCVDEDIVVTYTGTSATGMQFDWDFGTGTATPGTGAGPHTVSWADSGTQPITLTVTSVDGCVSEPFSANVQVDEPLVAPLINCNTTINSVEFSWPDVAGATSYDVLVLAGTAGAQTSQNTYEVGGLTPNSQVTIELTVTGSGACPPVTAQQTCIAQDCETVTIAIIPVGDICLDANAGPVTMQATATGGVGGGTMTWSGTGVSAGGVFDPAVAMVGAHTLTATYTEGDCVYTQTTVVNVLAQPTASFTAPPTVCEGDEISVSYTGTPQVSFDWDFGTATATPGTGAGPHSVSWADSGTQPITLTVTSPDGCVSEPFSANVQVDEPLVAPLINCNTTISSIEFSWPDVAGATSYDVVVLAGTAGTLTSQNTYEVGGLLPNDEVTIELTVTGNGICPPVTVEQTCIAQDCLPIVVSIAPVAPICIDVQGTLQLEALVTGAAGSGTGTWSGPGTSASGVFDPVVAGVGTHQVVYVYVENNCTYQAAGSVQVLPMPSADFSASANICIEDAATVTYEGAAPPTATYTWNFGGGNATPGTGEGPHEVTFPAAGSYDVTLTVTQNGCTSTQVVQTVQVDPVLIAPDIDCNTTVSSIEFVWDTVANGTDYEVTVLTGQTGSQTSLTAYLLAGLQPNEEVTIELTVSGNTLCPPVTVQETCIATDCPTVTIEIAPIDPICFGANAGTVQLEATVTGGSGTAGTWSGTGVSSSGVFNPATAGIGTQTITFVYEENPSCSYDQNAQVVVVAPPVADAGPDGEITCEENQTSVELGGDGSTTGAGITYEWSAASGDFPGDANILYPIVSVPGTYTLTVTNTALPNCADTDVVEVSASQDIPQPQLAIVPVSCFGENDGAISVVNVTGGQVPYLYAINGGDYSTTSTFQQLAPGEYVVSVIDASGCEATITIDITQPQELNVTLVAIIEGGGNIIRLGDTTELQALVNLPADSLDNVQWFPRELVSCDTCLNTFTSPTSQTTFSITVESNGCVASDDLTLFVKKDRPVYVPNAFSPNGDGPNEKFMIFAGKEVAKVRSFLVFDRWGETVFQFYKFPPNDPAYGWDGRHRGDLLNPGVFTWYAEIEFVDGKVELYEGDVTLMR